VIDFDKNKDIAVLKIDGKDLPTVSIGDSDKIKVGEDIVVIGNPEGLNNTVSKGIVSSTDREFEGMNYIQIDAPISEGSSGGPIFDGKGRVIAIATLILKSGQNLNFGVPINTIFKSQFKNLVSKQD
jgi:S1-C subfamily serine protease